MTAVLPDAPPVSRRLTHPSPLAEIAPDSSTRLFDSLRCSRETQNEIIISYIQIGALLSAFLVNVATHVLPIAPYVGSDYRLIICGVAIAARLIIVAVLHKKPVYVRWRKYGISSFDLLVFTVLLNDLGVQSAYPWTFVTAFSLCAYAILVILNGLRYSTNVVLYNTFIASILYAVVFIPHIPADYRVITFLLSIGMLMPTAFCVSYSVKSLLQMHQESTLKEHLTRFLAPELVQQVALDPALLQRSTKRQMGTVVFADIRGFTRLSETLPPEDVVEALNAFLQEMTTAILHHQGMVDKYIGDAVMGVFGVPLRTTDHATRALRAALEMRDRMVLLNETLHQRGLPQLAIGIGIHTGEVLIGTIGSRMRLDYTVIGDTVNTASRIEGLTRRYGVDILLSQETCRCLTSPLKLYEIDTVQVKNRQQPLVVWSPELPQEEQAAPGGAIGEVDCELVR